MKYGIKIYFKIKNIIEIKNMIISNFNRLFFILFWDVFKYINLGDIDWIIIFNNKNFCFINCIVILYWFNILKEK